MGAVISGCGTWRYRLEREVQPEGCVFAWFGINPSTATATEEDATTRRWFGFARRLGARRYIAGNLFAYRTPYVDRLEHAADPVGPDADEHLDRIIHEADVLIPCWGPRTKVPSRLRHRIDTVAARLLASGKPVRALAITADGSPGHPLMLSYDRPLLEWPGYPHR